MMPGLPALLSRLPGDPAIVHPLIAVALAVAIYLVASAASRFASPRLRRRFRALGRRWRAISAQSCTTSSPPP